ncbi:GNAT family N-acetyltransferase [Thalassobaculum sp.]|uniref:GNAT family N-acetyltransferase n=1 Tax=Thalassobaculum sp. TaxID=2022740 RepID=UPI003B5C489F
MSVQVELVEGKGDPLEAVRRQAIDWLGEHAKPHGVAWNFQEFALRALRDGELVGTLVGSTNLHWLHVSLLAVRPAERRGGVGGALLARAEELARGRACIGAWLDTYDFQAPDFYPRFGYVEFGRIEDMPPGHRRYFFTKRL